MPGCGGRQTGYIKAEEHKKNDAKGVFLFLWHRTFYYLSG